jgi:hypothetical protein
MFRPISEYIVGKLLAKLDNSTGAGVTGISTKILKESAIKLAPFLADLFNECLIQQTIPEEWKLALVTPLFKNKGNPEDVNNYRGISVLPPIAKLFEKIIANQIIIYFNINNLFNAGQFGFRANHSCESALHSIISEINHIKNKRLVGLLLFVDFRKAFDLVDSNLLLKKLKLYGFDQSALNLLFNYFKNRNQCVKYDGETSAPRELNLGVPQRSVLGPILFLIFINTSHITYKVYLLCSPMILLLW